MDNVRLLLWFALLGTLWVAYTTWVADYAPPSVETSVPSAPVVPADRPIPPIEGSNVGSSSTSSTPIAPLTTPASAAPRETVRVRTDVLDVLIDLAGGDLVRADLPTYPVEKHEPDRVVRLLDYAPEARWVFETGIRTGTGSSAPDHLATFRSEREAYELAPDQDTLTVTLEWVGSGEIAARKVYTFRRGHFAIDLEIVLENRGTAPWSGDVYTRMTREHRPPERSYTSVDSYSFTGPVLYDGDSFEKLDVEELAEMPVDENAMGGWYAGIQHHFLAGAVPPAEDATSYKAAAVGSQGGTAATMRYSYELTTFSPPKNAAPGATLSYPLKLFVGPKIQEQLRETAQEMDLTVDYGMFRALAYPLFRILSFIHDWVGNWGWAIIICTILIKAVFYKLTATSGRSMAKMRKLAPRMKTLQERYKDDRQKLSQAMMELYKKEKVNPAAGCLPLLIQMPFFFAFYWVLIESVEMRQAPFMLWIDDLSVRDPFFVLPLLMGAAMLFQTRLNPAPPDPVQARIMQIMPIAFTVFFALFPAGLVIYWLTSTLLSILQQWRINVLVAREG